MFLSGESNRTMMKIIRVVIFFVFFASLLSYLWYKPIVFRINPEVLNNSYSRYEVMYKSLEEYTSSPVFYPHVSISPASNRYFVMPLYEKYQISTNQKDKLFFASKRVNELITWGNTFQVENVYNDDGTYGRGEKNNILLSIRTSPSWESILNRYEELVSEYIQDVKNTFTPEEESKKIIETKNTLHQHNERLISFIRESTFPQDKKRQLEKFVNNIYVNLYEKATSPELEIIEKNVYDVRKIHENYDSGRYKVYFDINDLPSIIPIESIVLKVNNNNYLPSLLQGGIVTYEDVLIPSGNNEIRLSVPLYIIDNETLSYTASFRDDTFIATKLEERYVVEKLKNKYKREISSFLPPGVSKIRIISEKLEDGFLSLDKINEANPNETYEHIYDNLQENTTKKDILIENSTSTAYFLTYWDVGDGIVPQIPLLQIEVTAVSRPKLIFEKVAHQNKAQIIYRDTYDGSHIQTSHMNEDQLQILLRSFGPGNLVTSMQNNGEGYYTVVVKSQVKDMLLKVTLITAIALVLMASNFHNKAKKYLYYITSISNTFGSIFGETIRSLEKMSLSLSRFFAGRTGNILSILFIVLMVVDIFFIRTQFEIFMFAILTISLFMRNKGKFFFILGAVCILIAVFSFFLDEHFIFNDSSLWAFTLIIALYLQLLRDGFMEKGDISNE